MNVTIENVRGALKSLTASEPQKGVNLNDLARHLKIASVEGRHALCERLKSMAARGEVKRPQKAFYTYHPDAAPKEPEPPTNKIYRAIRGCI